MDEKKLRKYAGIEKLDEGKATPVLFSVAVKEIADELRKDKKLVQRIVAELIADKQTRKQADTTMTFLEELTKLISFANSNR